MRRGLALSLFKLLLFTALAEAGDHYNIEENLPVRVEDAYTIGYRGRELQYFTRWERTGDGADRVVYGPQLEIGFAPQWQFSASSGLFSGNADRTGSGDLTVEVLRNINTETKIVPAFGIAGLATFPTGKNSEGVDPGLKVLATKTIAGTRYFNRLHGNFILRHNTARMSAEERKERYAAIFGYDAVLSSTWQVVGDYVFEQQRERGQDFHLLEGGLRVHVHPLWILSFGAGAGLTAESPNFRIAFGVQRVLTFFDF